MTGKFKLKYIGPALLLGLLVAFQNCSGFKTATLSAGSYVGRSLGFSPLVMQSNAGGTILHGYIASTVGVVVNATYDTCPNLAVKLDLYVNESGRPVIHNRCFINSAADPTNGSSWCMYQHPLAAGGDASKIFVRTWQAASDCVHYADEMGDSSGYVDNPLSGSIKEDVAYPESTRNRVVTIDKASYRAVLDPNGGATYEYYSKRINSTTLLSGEYANAIYSNSGAALQIALFGGGPGSLTSTGCLGQGFYNPTQAGAGCSYYGSVAGAVTPTPGNSGLTVSCDGGSNSACRSASNTFAIGNFRMMNYDYGPGYQGPYNNSDQTYMSQSVVANDNFIEYNLQFQHAGASFTGLTSVAPFLSNQFRRVTYRVGSAALTTIDIPINRTGLDSKVYPQTFLGKANWATVENTSGLVTNDFMTIAWMYAPDIVADFEPNWNATYSGISMTESPIYHQLMLGNSYMINIQQGKAYHLKYVVFPYRYDETISSRFGTMTVEQTIAQLTAEYQSNYLSVSTSAAAPSSTGLAASANKVIGFIDGISNIGGTQTITGWACATGLATSITVHLYLDGPAGSGQVINAYSANLASESAVANSCQSTGTNYRFAMPLPSDFLSNNAGRIVYIHGISPNGQPNNLLTNSGIYLLPGGTSATCSINGGAGKVIVAPSSQTKANCASQCQLHFATQPNLSCVWGSQQLAPVGSCQITGGAGAALFGASDTHGDCYNQCSTLHSNHPNQTCSWNGGTFTL